MTEPPEPNRISFHDLAAKVRTSRVSTSHRDAEQANWRGPLKIIASMGLVVLVLFGGYAAIIWLFPGNVKQAAAISALSRE